MFLFLILGLSLSSSYASDPAKYHSTAEVIPITMANLHGHEKLYSEGWFFVTSSKEAFTYAQKNGVEVAGQAYARLKESLQETASVQELRKTRQKEREEERKKKSADNEEKRASAITQATDKAYEKINQEANRIAQESWQKFTEGSVHLVTKTKEERESLKSLPGGYFADLKSDSSNLSNLASVFALKESSKAQSVWKSGFEKAADDFNTEYKKSGEQHNSLSGLGYILWGYMKSFYHGLVGPTAETAAITATQGASYFAQYATLAVGETLSFSGRTVENVGLSIFYTASMGYKILAPTLESGILVSMAAAEKLAAVSVMAGGRSVGLVNQVAVKAVAPAASAAGDVAGAGIENAFYAGIVTFDVLKAGGEVALSEVKTGIVLGYNALTAIPTQLLLGSANAAFFLAWDGPRLVIAKVSGNLDAQNLPVGTLINLNEVKKDPRLKVETIDQFPEDVQKVLKELPNDLH